jgi:hypothetical protein
VGWVFGEGAPASPAHCVQVSVGVGADDATQLDVPGVFVDRPQLGDVADAA